MLSKLLLWILSFSPTTELTNNTKYQKGYIPPINQHIIRTHFDYVSELPNSLDWREFGVVNPVKDQAQCGSCWAFSAVGALESQVMKATGGTFSLSEQELVDCLQPGDVGGAGSDCCYGCQGGQMFAVYEYLNGTMDDTERQYPYEAVDQQCQTKKSQVPLLVTGYVALPVGDEESMLNALYHVGPLSVGVNANDDWQMYTGGVYNPTADQCSSDPMEQDHGVIVVGYGTDNTTQPPLDYWLIRNSWGKDWGESGYMRLARGKNANMENACGVADTPIYPLVEVKDKYHLKDPPFSIARQLMVEPLVEAVSLPIPTELPTLSRDDDHFYGSLYTLDF